MSRSCEDCIKSIVCAAKKDLEDNFFLKYGFILKLESSTLFWQSIAGKCSQYISSKEGT